MSRLTGLRLALSILVAAPSGAAAADARVAHTQLESSTPAAGDTVMATPRELVLTFGGLVEEAGAFFRLLGPSGRNWTLEGSRLPGSARALTSPMPALAPGAYRLEWRVISGDGHPISGDFVFFVGAGGGAGGRPTELGTPPPPSAEGLGSHEAAGRAPAGGAASAWLMVTRAGADAAVLLLAGLLMFGSLGGGVPSARTATVTLALSAAAPALVAVYAWLWSGSVLGGGGAARIDALASLFTGRALTAELVLVAFAPWALLLARRPRLAMVFAGSSIVAGAFAGHASSYTPLVSVPASALHQLVVATWLGGLLFLVTEARSATFARSARRVSDAALGAVAAVALTGLLQGWLLIDSLAQALSTPYGLLLLGKVAGLLGLVVFGVYHRFRLMPALASPDGAARLSRSVRMELAVALGVVTLAAVLSHIPPNP